ncbi:MAG: imidazoleglycerol-phosphate dehydratase HisB [Bacteroidota bacterium]
MTQALSAVRTASVSRETRETNIQVSLNLDGSGTYDNKTGVGFFDHMLDLFAKHGAFDLTVHCDGDLHIDDHHTIEDVGIVMGQAFSEALGDKAYINRYGAAYVPMDEALARAVVDLSGRFYLQYDASFVRNRVGAMSTEMVEHFWYSFAEKAGMNLHINILSGRNAHHKIEAIFKAVARALREAVKRDTNNAKLASTKGAL